MIGAGHSGLAMSKCLSDRSIDHVVLERHEVGNSWRSERWDSLRLLTPNWQCRLPGYSYEGHDPNGFMTMSEVVDFIRATRRLIAAPVQTGTTVSSVRRTDGGEYRVTTNQDEWQCETVVVATGAFNVPRVPPVAETLPSSVTTLTPFGYKNPDQLAEGGVLVVGASATGVQIACEVQRSGRQVTLAVGEHVRGPGDYRGRDIHWWMDAAGVLDERYDEVDDIVRARRVPSMQLAGSPERANFDLNALTSRRRQAGRPAGWNRDGRAQFSGSLGNKCELADLKLGRLLDTIDVWAAARGLDDSLPPPHRFSANRRGQRTVARPRSHQRGDSDGDLGDGIPPGLFLARHSGPRRQGDASPRRRRCRFAGHVPARKPLSPPTQIKLHGWCPGRRPGAHRRARRLPRRESLGDEGLNPD